MSTSQSVPAESKDLLQSAADTLVYNKGKFELARRDNLLDLISNQVNPATKRALRLSKFDGVHCLQQELCEKAHTELREFNKNKGYTPSRKYKQTLNTGYKQNFA